MINYNTTYHITELEIKEKIVKLLPLENETISLVLFDRNNIKKSDIYCFLYRYINSINPNDFTQSDILDMIKNYSTNLIDQLISLSSNIYTKEEIELYKTYLYYTLIQQFSFNGTTFLKSLILDLYELISKFNNIEINTPIWCCKEELRNIILVYYNRYTMNHGNIKELPFNILEQIDIIKNNNILITEYINTYIKVDNQ